MDCRFWTHLVMAYAFTFWTCYILKREYQIVATMRLHFLASERRRPDQFTVRISFISEQDYMFIFVEPLFLYYILRLVKSTYVLPSNIKRTVLFTSSDPIVPSLLQKYWRKTADNKLSFTSVQVLVRNVPPDPDESVSELVEHFFLVNHPDHYLTHQVW